jgi:hypothetical protein
MRYLRAAWTLRRILARRKAVAAAWRDAYRVASLSNLMEQLTKLEVER